MAEDGRAKLHGIRGDEEARWNAPSLLAGPFLDYLWRTKMGGVGHLRRLGPCIKYPVYMVGFRGHSFAVLLVAKEAGRKGAEDREEE